MRTKTKSGLYFKMLIALFVLIFLLIIVPSGLISAEPIEIRISPTDNHQFFPDIYENKVVWQDDRDGNIHLYDVLTGEEIRISPTGTSQTKPAIYGNKVVWQDYRSGGYYQIYLYDILTGEEIRIAPTSRQQTNPAIFGDKVVWEDDNLHYPSIYIYDILTGDVSVINDTGRRQNTPAIYGDKVVWQEKYASGNHQIILHDISTGEETRISPTNWIQQYPDIYENKVVWQDSRYGYDFQIHLYDISTGEEIKISPTTNINQRLAAIYENKVVWQQWSGGPDHVYLHDLLTGETIKISPPTGYVYQIQSAIYEDRVVWADDRNNGRVQIYLYLPAPLRKETNLILNFPSTVQYSDELSGNAALTSEGESLDAKDIDFNCLVDAQTTPTDANGVATASQIIDIIPGSYEVCASFAGDEGYLASTADPAAVNVEKENAFLAYTGDILNQVGTDTNLTCLATQEDDGSPGDITLLGPVTFIVTSEENFLGTYDASVGSDGIATAQAILPVGIYSVTAEINSDYFGADPSEEVLIAVYDPSGGFVTGGGWISSSEGAYIADPSLTGKANFGFVSKYKKGAGVPTGSTEFQFKIADFNFHSSDYEWLVLNQGGSNAQFKGTGTINDAGSYKFMLWAGDDADDTFRIKIWTEEDEIENIVYDNGVQQVIGGGSIIVHKK